MSEHVPGVAAGTLRRIAFVVVLVAAVGVAVVDRAAGVNAAFAGILMALLYGTFVAVPIQVLYRDLRLRPPGVAVFVVTVLAIVGAFWCAPLAKDQFTCSGRSRRCPHRPAVRRSPGRRPPHVGGVERSRSERYGTARSEWV